MVWGVLALLLLGGLAAYVYPRKTEKTAIAEETERPSSAVARISAFAEAYSDRIFSPLNSADTIIPVQDLNSIRASLRDLQSGASGSEVQLYGSAVRLADLLAKGIEDRESHNRRLAEVRAKKTETRLARPGERINESIERDAFFERGVAASWERTASTLRASVRRQYYEVRRLEQVSGME
jgi:hypothetical protein